MAKYNNTFFWGSLLAVLALFIFALVLLFSALSLGHKVLPNESHSAHQQSLTTGVHPGEQIVKSICKRCHAFGMMRAPKLGSERDWAPRIEKGKDVLYDHALNGFNKMPARGDRDLSDEQVKAAVDYMISLLDFD